MLGRGPEYWQSQLTSDHLPVRLFALRIIRQMGSQGARMLLETRVDLPEWPLVWALQGCATPALLRSAPANSPQRLALTLQRRTPRARGKLARHTLEACITGIRSAQNPHLRLSWMMVLLEQHGEAAAEDLVQLISTPTPQRSQWEPMASLAAWALGQLGRSPLFAIQERFRQSNPTIQLWLCQVVWYLGPQAHGSESFVASIPGVWASAALYSLESTGSRALIQRREAPVWVDKVSLGRLAELVQSAQREDRLYAARALPGWGPALPRVARLLERICHDPDPELRDTAWRGLKELGGVTSTHALKTGLQSQEAEVRRAALACFRDNYGEHPLELLQRNMHDPEIGRLAVLAIQEGGLQPGDVEAALSLAPRLTGIQILVLLNALAALPPPEPGESLDVSQLAGHDQVDVRQALARLLLAWNRSPQELLPFSQDKDANLSQLATEFILDHGDPSNLLQLLQDGPRLARRLALMESRSVLARWLGLGPGHEQLAALLDRLRQLSQHSESEVAKAASRVLKGQSLDTLIWADFESLEPALQESITRLIRETSVFPEALRAALLEGLYISPATLSLATDLLPTDRVSTLLWSMFIKAPRPKREHFFQPLLRLGNHGWNLLLEWMSHQDTEVAEDAVRLLLRWVEQVGKDGLQDESILKLPLSDAPRRQLAQGLAEILLTPQSQLDFRWFSWALALSRHNDGLAAGLAVQALSRYFGQAEEDDRERALQSILRACNHPQCCVRLEAVAQLIRIDLSESQRWRVATTLRVLGADPDPRVQSRRLLWLQKSDELTTYEIQAAQNILCDCDDAEVIHELQALLC